MVSPITYTNKVVGSEQNQETPFGVSEAIARMETTPLTGTIAPDSAMQQLNRMIVTNFNSARLEEENSRKIDF